MNRALALLSLTVAYAVGVALLRALPEPVAGSPGSALLQAMAVTPAAWAGLYAACVLAGLVLWQSPAGRAPARAWLAWAVYAPLLAALFLGANGALDALHGAGRPKARVADALGGLEVWFVWVPGGLSLALGGAVHSAVSGWRGRRPTAMVPPSPRSPMP